MLVSIASATIQLLACGLQLCLSPACFRVAQFLIELQSACMYSAAAGPVLPDRVRAYLEEVVHTCGDHGRALVSVVIFGSAVIGGWSDTVSDVDVILILPDGVLQADRNALREKVERIETSHGLRRDSGFPKGALERLVDRITANVRSFFICTRGDLLSGSIGRILDLPSSQAVFVDRAVLANIVASGKTVWGEDLLSRIPVAPIRRFDVLKAFFGLFSQALLSASVFPLLPGATKYAMGALKRSVHNCFFCFELRRASLEEEIGFFTRRGGPKGALIQLLALRRDYRESFTFVLSCIPTLVRLHLRTAIDNRFPRQNPVS
ncbi:MAG: nucleotidyltransferase domain-containing protein [Acidobacteriia bacterium]|nr:nucleotidyltransferase domain-containing protein [Terriglobia bacterium]